MYLFQPPSSSTSAIFRSRFTFHYVSISTFENMPIHTVDENLHSTMYLFQHAFSTLLINVHYVFTFHYVSISTSYCNGFISRNDIYIPLCIYFNLCNSLANVFLILIYIPLCIYFNSLSGRNRNSFICIYIPLCIYFNLFDDPHLCDVVLFTFHYVSISTNLKCHSVMFLQIFTFHYVSISTCLTDTKLCTSLYLHSTMYLFQRYCRMQSGKE